MMRVSLLLIYTSQADGELGQVGCFHRQRVMWAFRQQGEEQKWRSLFYNVLPCHVGTGVGNPVSFTSVCAFVQWLCPLCLFWLLNSLLGLMQAPFPQDVLIIYVFLECNHMQSNSH